MRVRVRRYRASAWRDEDVIVSCPEGSPLHGMIAEPGVVQISVTRKSGDETVYTKVPELALLEEG